jgi:hypothetical protein
MTLRIWHIPNPPRAQFQYPVASPALGKAILNAIAAFDLWLDDHGPWKNVGERRAKVAELREQAPEPHRRIVGRALKDYNSYINTHNCYHVHTNAQGLEEFEGGSWGEWYDQDSDEDISAFELDSSGLLHARGGDA